MTDKSGNNINQKDIIFAVKGTSMRHYLVCDIMDDHLLKCQEVTIDFDVVKQPKGKKYTYIKPFECLLHSKLIKDKYVKVL